MKTISKKIAAILSLLMTVLYLPTAFAGKLDYTKTKNQYVKIDGVKYAYRTIGNSNGKVPLVLFQHFTGTMDDWDSALINGLAQKRKVYIFDNAGVGASEGSTPESISAMSKVAQKFVENLKVNSVDILGFSMGGCIAQQFLVDRPDLVRKAILVGTAPKGYGGEGTKELPAVMDWAFKKANEAKTHPKVFLFFTESESGKMAAQDFLKRIGNHSVDPEKQVSQETMNAQMKAIVSWGRLPKNFAELKAIKQPVLIVNGSNDEMAPTPMSFELFQNIPNAQLSLYPDSGHGALFQYHSLFVSQVNTFLDGVIN